MGNYGVEYGFVGIFVKVFFLVLIIAFVYLMARRNRHHPMWGQHMESAIDIAKKRYAKGELTKEEYQDILKNLK
ncbi:MAG: hypothetical protein A2Y40_09505 [Candidatus Margulisbacteria bacterium GWF2_35_9]|nr:MAG: hypothetical protein A2Y40_09505 [Candidatus Margulisbacteria bacterium GWF2_35_9]